MTQQRLIALIEIGQRIVDDFPVYQILGMQDRQAWHTLERRSGHIIILTAGTHAYIRVAIVGINHGIGVGTIAMIGAPHL